MIMLMNRVGARRQGASVIAAIAVAPAFAFAAFTIPAQAASPATPAVKISPEDKRTMKSKIDAIRDEAKALTLVQSVLGWYSRTQGEESIQAESFKGHEALFSKENVALVDRAFAAAGSPRASDDARALDFLHTYLALSTIALDTAHFDDEQANAEASTTVTLSFMNGPVAYRDLQGLLSTEEAASRRDEIQAKSAGVYRDILNPIIAAKEVRSQELVRDLGFRSYVELSEKYRWMDLKQLIRDVDAFYRSTDALYRKVFAEEAKESLGIEASAVRRGDIGRLARAPQLERFLPKELEIPAFREFLRGIGLDLTTVAGTDIRIDDAPNPKKEPRAACFPIRVPGDIRVTVKPTGGMDDFHTLFHEGGHALHFGSAKTDRWEFQLLGPSMSTEGWAEFFSHSWDDPVWLMRYREFVRKWNADHPTAAGGPIPLMTDADIEKTVRHRVFWNLYFMRRYGHAKLIYESILHGGDPSLYKDIYTGQTGDLQEAYRTLFQEAYGFPLSSQDALRFRTDVDDFFYAADYTRAYAFADMMHEASRAKFGDDWYGNPAVGKWLREVFWKDGTKLQGDEIVTLAGLERFDLDIARARYERLLAWDESQDPNSTAPGTTPAARRKNPKQPVEP